MAAATGTAGSNWNGGYWRGVWGRPYWRGSYWGGYWGPSVGISWGTGWPYWGWGLPYYSAAWAPYYAASWTPVQTDVIEDGTVYTAPAPSAPTTYWYYCKEPAGYFPYVQSCNQAWIPVDAAIGASRTGELT